MNSHVYVYIYVWCMWGGDRKEEKHMKQYYVNKNSRYNPGFNNEVHTSTCQYLPLEINRQYLGEFANGVLAVQKAKQIGYLNADGCWLCCPEAHRG